MLAVGMGSKDVGIDSFLEVQHKQKFDIGPNWPYSLWTPFMGHLILNAQVCKIWTVREFGNAPMFLEGVFIPQIDLSVRILTVLSKGPWGLGRSIQKAAHDSML